MHGSNDINEGTIPELGYDHRDVNMAAIVKWMTIFAAFVTGSIIAIQFVFYPLFTPDWKKLEREVPAFVTKPRQPPYPQVQADPKLDMEIYKASEESQHEGLQKAKEALATRGISGITGESSKSKEEGHSYPGSGDYTGAEKHTSSEAPAAGEHSGGEH